MSTGSHELSAALQSWQQANVQLGGLQERLAAAILAAAGTGGEAPRELIIAIERQREHADELLQAALNLLDAQSSIRTGMTGFGSLPG